MLMWNFRFISAWPLLRALSPNRQHPSRFGTYELRDREAGPVNYDTKLDLEEYAEMAQ